MSEEKSSFIERVKRTLAENGFPAKKVSLPLEKMYEVAESKNINFNDVLLELEKAGMAHEKKADKIIFFSSWEMEQNLDQHQHQQQQGPFQGQNFDQLYRNIFERFKGMDLGEMMKNPQLLFQNLTPEELQSLQEFYQKLDPNERDQLLKKAKDLGFS